MKDQILRFLFLWFCLSPLHSFAQKITGTWEGEMDDEWLEVNIRQEGNKACGYTYDFILGNRRNFCKAYFEGYYDKRMEYWVLNGTGFYENEGGHVLMTLKLWLDKSTKPHTLRGTVGIKASLNSLMGLNSPTPVALTRSSSRPKNIPGSESPCFEPERIITKNKKKQESKEASLKKSPVPAPTPANKETVTVKPIQPGSPEKSKPKAPVKKTPPVASKSNPKPVIPKPEKPSPLPKENPPTEKKDSNLVKQSNTANTIPAPEKKLLSRKNREMKRLTVHVDKINLKLYDNGVIDNDTVSIYYNGRLLVNKQVLSEKAINIDLTLDPTAKEHTITMYAENLGSIPPNTALVVVTAGKNRYELFSSSSLEENAVLIFDYEPE